MAKGLYDQFRIINKKELNSDDIYSMTYLYMPILGMDSYSLYIALSTFEINEIKNYKKLIDLLSLNTLTTLVNAFNKLEGMGLVKEYKKDTTEEEIIAYSLIKPMSVYSFLKDEALRSLLISEIGEDEVLKLFEKSQAKKAPVGYHDATKSFDDVFEISTENDNKIWKNIFADKKWDVVIENKNFNYHLFESLAESTFITSEMLANKDFRREITHLSFVYNLDEHQMVDVVFKSIDLDKTLDYDVLSKNAKFMFQEVHEVTNPRLVSQEDDTYMDSAKDDKLIALCTRLESYSFSEVLEILSGIQPAVAEIDMFEKIYSKSTLTYGAINVMIMMANYEKEGVIPGLNYFEKIANTWSRAKVRNAYDALKYCEKQIKDKKESMSRSGKREVQVPLWYSQYKAELDKKEEGEMSDASKDILAAANELFGE